MDAPAPGIRELARLLKAARRIAVLTGAGMSTESGIPDFRSPGGLYETVGEGIFQLDAFQAHPERFWRAIGPFYQSVLQASPNPGHEFLAALEKAPWEKEVCVATQNIDVLHQKAGSRTVCTLHGTMERLQCPRCDFQDHSLPFLPVMEKGECPRCPRCGAILKPAIVFFGEELPQRDFSTAVRAFQDCDLALVLGTSLQVTPASWLPSERGRNATLVILNREETWMDKEAALVLHDSIAEILSQCPAEMQ
ncbi:MAG: SIR2 family NAD-dependent protein deacylase [Oligosphaeraceae bacterium]